MTANSGLKDQYAPATAAPADQPVDGVLTDGLPLDDPPSWTAVVRRPSPPPVVHLYGQTDTGQWQQEVVSWIEAAALVLVIGVVLLLVLGVPLPEIFRMFVDARNRMF